jgi:phosphoribosylanthranilate isomerase
VRIKICGITRLEDALCAEDSGADAIGFIFVPNTKRFVQIERAAEISRGLGAFISRVGVFRGAGLQTILETVSAAQLSAVQLHEDSDAFCAKVAEYIPIIRAVSFKPGLELPATNTLHIDGLEPGSGQAFDWNALDASSLRGRRWMLAGGLNPENVSSAVRALQPWGVDVSSGVESGPGIKDHDKIRAFVRAARAAAPSN